VPDEARQPSICLKWCQFTQSVSFGRWEKGLVHNAFLPVQRGILFFKNIFAKTVKPYIQVTGNQDKKQVI